MVNLVNQKNYQTQLNNLSFKTRIFSFSFRILLRPAKYNYKITRFYCTNAEMYK